MTRHKSLSSAMSALMAYKNRPEGKQPPVQTNWSLVSVNDNEPELVAMMAFDRKRIITPSIEELAAQVNEGEIKRDKGGALLSVGKLRFSDGEKYETGYKYGPGGEVISTKHRMPAWSMLGCRDKLDIELGRGDDATETIASNNHFADVFRVKKRPRQPSKKRRNGDGYTHEEAKRLLAEAYANTPVMPEVTKYPAGLPAAGNRVSDSFLGMKKSACAGNGSASWQDVCTALVEREIWAESLDALSDKDRKTLDTVMEAKRLPDLAEGKRGGNAYIAGRKRLREANDNLKNILRKAA